MDKKNLLGFFVFLGLLSIAISIPIAFSIVTESSRTVSVRGLCEEEVFADRAIWPIVYKEGGNSLSDITKTISEKNAQIVDWLKSAGFNDDEISVSSPKLDDLRSGYSEKRPYDFSLTSVITVCTSKVKEVVKLQSRQADLLAKGIGIGAGSEWEYPITYDYTALNDIKPQMIEKATVNARQAADKFAHDSGQKVGKIQNATQGQFSITNRDENTPFIKTVRVVTSIVYQLK